MNPQQVGTMGSSTLSIACKKNTGGQECPHSYDGLSLVVLIVKWLR